MSLKDKLKSKLQQKIEKIDFTRENWSENFSEWQDSSTKTEILWILQEWVKEGKYIEAALKIAELFSTDQDPEGDGLNEKILNGEDMKFVYTVRGTVPWLLQAIVATLKTYHYEKVLDIIEALANDEIYYVRQQATVPLCILAANYNAKKNPDGSNFVFLDEDRKRTHDLALTMLRENKTIPRVLEYVVNVFDKLRFISEKEAQESLEIFFFDHNDEPRPGYLSSHAIPLAIFFAEFRKKFTTDFKNENFQSLLIKIIETADNDDLKSAIVWNFWRLIEDSPVDYTNIKQYIPLFFKWSFGHSFAAQFEFLVKAILNHDSKDGAILYKDFLEYLNSQLPTENKEKIWLLYTEDTLEDIKRNQGDVAELLDLLRKLHNKGCRIGDISRIFG